ncbi:coatomer WD associated region-domain-containing protein [Catenaria anguillulae PL171]|uniref:Coatomer subunit beta' n=1 Tax=Catenaria anguillulae PL171 TaxID=765915 RepID=A0A1Y2HGC1_9FUNG|nr:coatomer WD associated region-domain-containing protein [Catenaria anguillulae PL171]
MGKMRLDIKRKFTARTDRVKCVDIHPTEPWVLAALYNGSIWVWNYETQATVKTFEVSELPLRAAKFVARKSWIIAGGDEMHLKVYNYNTFEKVTQVEAHYDYIRSIAVHPTQPLVLTCADDFLIKLWDWEKGWKNIMTFEGHTHFIFAIAFNPKDSNTFASGSLDCTIKVWNINSPTANFTLNGHQKGVNSIDYYHGGDKPYLISGADDHKVMIWDLQNKTCVASLDGHTNNVMATMFHPELPIALTGAEDGTLKVWNAQTNKLEHSLNYGMERVWSLAYQKGSNTVAVGYDEGCVVLRLGREEPAVSMDTSGKVIWAKHSEILTANLRALSEASTTAVAASPASAAPAAASTITDGERLVVPVKELGTCEMYPQSLIHSPNGRFVVVTGDGEYIVYTALAWRNKAYGSAIEFAWSPSNEYAIRESPSRIKLFDKQFKEKPLTQVPGAVAAPLNQLNYAADAMFSGPLLAVRSSAGFVTFYDWETGRVVRRIEAAAKAVHWNEVGDMVALVTDDALYVLRYSVEAWVALGNTPQALASEEGVEQAFTVVHEVPEQVRTGTWVGDCFLFTTQSNRLNYVVGGNVITLTHFDAPMHLLGYLAKDNRVYYCDKDINFYSWSLPLTVIQYQTAVLRGDLETAAQLLPSVPETERDRLGQFLEKQGLHELALEVTTDTEHKFDLAVAAGKLDVALQLAIKVDQPAKWKIVAEGALAAWRFDVAEECMTRANDLESLMLLYLAAGNAGGLRKVADKAAAEGKHNVAFAAYTALGDTEQAIKLLMETDRVPEAALLARTVAPSKLPEVTAKWRESVPARIAETIGDVPVPAEWIEAETQLGGKRFKANEYPAYRELCTVPLLQELHMKRELQPSSIAATVGSEPEASKDEGENEDGVKTPSPTGETAPEAQA